MTGNPDGLRSLAKYSKLPVERIRYFPDADESVVTAITRGILFQMAFWSGPAVQAFTELAEVVARLDPDGVTELVVVDIDGAERLSAASEFLGGVRGRARRRGSETARSSPRTDPPSTSSALFRTPYFFWNRRDEDAR